MTQPYPIISRRYLSPAAPRGFLKLGRRNRNEDGLPKPHAHEVMVYRVDGQYVLDNGSRPLDDDVVVRSSHVTLVDVSRDVPVIAQLVLPSSEASEFTVHVTFVCSVLDPVRVARENVHAETVMTNYLKHHRKIFELGLPYSMMQINEARRDVSAQITAYTTVVPPVVPGMAVRMTSVEVRTPEELIPFERERRKARMERILDIDREEYAHERDVVRTEWAQQGDVVREDHRHERDSVGAERRRRSEVDEQEHQMGIGARAQRHRHALERDQAEFAQDQLHLIADAIDNDPYRATVFAHAHGQLDAKQVAEQLEARRAHVEEVERTERADDKAAEREERRERREAERLTLDWDRKQQERRDREAREDSQRSLDRKFDLLRTIAQRGGLDMVNVGLEKLIADVFDLEPDPPLPAVDPIASPKPVEASSARVVDGEAAEPQGPQRDEVDDDEWREENSD